VCASGGGKDAPLPVVCPCGFKAEGRRKIDAEGRRKIEAEGRRKILSRRKEKNFGCFFLTTTNF
tara:strand:+ start:291 stop:482 length:192 start_codon:yes stop_codon:yes gene_type:complete